MIQGLLAHAGVELRTGVRDRTLLLMTYLLPLGFYGFMGVFMTEMNPQFVTVMIPGMTVFAMLTAAVLGLPEPLLSARATGVLRSYRINGVPTGAVFGVPAGTTVIHLLVAGGIIAATAPVLFDASPVTAVPFAFVLLVAGVTHAALGALIGIVSANSRIAVLWSQLLFLPSVLLAGIIVPLEQIPDLFRSLSLLLPATYAMEAFTGMAMGADTMVPPWVAVGFLAVGAASALALTRLCYAWDDHGAGRRLPPAFGLLALVPYAAGAVVYGF